MFLIFISNRNSDIRFLWILYLLNDCYYITTQYKDNIFHLENLNIHTFNFLLLAPQNVTYQHCKQFFKSEDLAQVVSERDRSCRYTVTAVWWWTGEIQRMEFMISLHLVIFTWVSTSRTWPHLSYQLIISDQRYDEHSYRYVSARRCSPGIQSKSTNRIPTNVLSLINI